MEKAGKGKEAERMDRTKENATVKTRLISNAKAYRSDEAKCSHKKP